MMGWENGSQVETVDFDYASLDGEESRPETLDESFWRMQGEFLEEVLRWLTVPKTLEGIGARVKALCHYLHPQLIDEKSLTQIGKLKGSPNDAALSKALILFQEQFNLHRGYYQKATYLRDVFRRSCIAKHADRKDKSNGSNGTNGNGKHPQHSVEYLKRQVADLERQLQETKDNSIMSVKERASKGGKSHKGTAFAARRARKAAKARWRKPR